MDIERKLNTMKYHIQKSLPINPFTKVCETRLPGTSKRFIESVMTGKNKNIKKTLSDTDIQSIRYDLARYSVPTESLEDIVCGLERKQDSLGVMKFAESFGVGMKTYQNARVLILAATQGGKSYLINSLVICDLDVAFSNIVLVMNETSFNNTATQTLVAIIKQIPDMHYQWIDIDQKEFPAFTEDFIEFDKLEKNKNGSYKNIWKNPNPSLIIFDDVYDLPRKHWVNDLIATMCVKGRHYMFSMIIALQGFTFLDTKIVDSVEKIFIHKDYIEREDIYRKLKREEPSNYHEVISDNERLRWYYLERSNDQLHPYVPYEFQTKHQIIEKMKSHLPKSITKPKMKKKFTEQRKKLEEYQKQKEKELDDQSFVEPEKTEKKGASVPQKFNRLISPNDPTFRRKYL